MIIARHQRWYRKPEDQAPSGEAPRVAISELTRFVWHNAFEAVRHFTFSNHPRLCSRFSQTAVRVPDPVLAPIAPHRDNLARFCAAQIDRPPVCKLHPVAWERQAATIENATITQGGWATVFPLDHDHALLGRFPDQQRQEGSVHAPDAKQMIVAPSAAAKVLAIISHEGRPTS